MKLSKQVQIILEILIVLIVGLIIFQPDIALVDILNEYAIWIIIAFVAMGLLSVMLNNNRFVYFFMLSAGILTFYLKDLSNENLVFNTRVNKKSALHFVHIDIFNTEDTKEDLLKMIVKKNPDIVGFEELTPDWNRFLIKNLKDKFNHILSMNRLDFDSKLVLSKYEFINKDTFYLSGHAQLDFTVFFRNNPLKILYSYVVPYTMIGENINNKFQLDDLAEYINKSRQSAVLVTGEFNQVYWTKRIRNFLYKTKLNNSRRFISFEKRNPYDHIFYSNRLRCVELNEIYDSKGNHIGIEGYFKILDPDEIPLQN